MLQHNRSVMEPRAGGQETTMPGLCPLPPRPSGTPCPRLKEKKEVGRSRLEGDRAPRWGEGKEKEVERTQGRRRVEITWRRAGIPPCTSSLQLHPHPVPQARVERMNLPCGETSGAQPGRRSRSLREHSCCCRCLSWPGRRKERRRRRKV